MKPQVTVILTQFLRNTLEEQIECILNQKDVDCHIWVDWTFTDANRHFDLPKGVNASIRNHNLYHGGRFFYAMNALTEYVYIVDDDMFPQPLYLASAIEQLSKTPNSVITSYGIELTGNGYGIKSKTCWHSLRGDKPNGYDTKKVDMGGHAWVARRNDIAKFALLPRIDVSNGEDIHFSYCLNQLGIDILVLGQDADNRDRWDTEPDKSWRIGNGQSATFNRDQDHNKKRAFLVDEYVKRGWKLNCHE